VHRKYYVARTFSIYNPSETSHLENDIPYPCLGYGILVILIVYQTMWDLKCGSHRFKMWPPPHSYGMALYSV